MNEGLILITGGNSDIGRCVVKAIRKELKCPIILTKNSQNFSYSEKNIEETCFSIDPDIKGDKL